MDPEISIPQQSKASFTKNLVLAVSVACLGSLQYGYHMAELNSPEGVISCKKSVPIGVPYSDSWFGRHGYQQCLDLDSQKVGFVTSVFSIGGLIGSFYAGGISEIIGRKRIAMFNCLVFIVGSFVNGISNSYTQLLVGRFIAGVSAGCALVVTPILINEISPPSLRGVLGSMNQVSVNIGILLTQVLALFWANNNQWRYLLFTGSVLGGLNFLALLLVDESPKWLLNNGFSKQAYSSLHKIRGGDVTSSMAEVDSWSETASISNSTQLEGSTTDSATLLAAPTKTPSLSFTTYVTSPTYRNSFIVSGGIMSCQQLCGINSIVFYGVSVLTNIFPSLAIAINCIISLANATITFAAAPLIDRLGRKPLLLMSVGMMGVSTVLMAVGIINNYSVLTVTSTFTYVSCFAIGLGPIPFLLVSEITQHEARGVAQSWATSTNWISTFLIGALFPIVKNSIGGGVYFIFTAACVFTFWFINTHVPETKGLDTYEEVWGINHFN